VQEQVDLFSRWAKAGSSTADFLASYALTASGFAQRKPERIREAYGRLAAAGQLGIEPFLACQQLLLGQVEQAEAHFDRGASPELRQWASEQGQGSLERLCAYCRDWLAREVLPGYRDIEGDADLDAWFADRDVQAYVEQQDRRSGRQQGTSGREPGAASPSAAAASPASPGLEPLQAAPWNAPWLELPSPSPLGEAPGALAPEDDLDRPQAPWAGLRWPTLAWPAIDWPELVQPASQWVSAKRSRLRLRQRLGSGRRRRPKGSKATGPAWDLAGSRLGPGPWAGSPWKPAAPWSAANRPSGARTQTKGLAVPLRGWLLAKTRQPKASALGIARAKLPPGPKRRPPLPPAGPQGRTARLGIPSLPCPLAIPWAPPIRPRLASLPKPAQPLASRPGPSPGRHGGRGRPGWRGPGGPG
jgi:hypothetical protein